eukprot:8125553-Prorocentrum_lima.AAC.1
MEEEGKEPMTGKGGRRICPKCELKCRKEDWPKLKEQEGVDHLNYCTYEHVVTEMNAFNKGAY